MGVSGQNARPDVIERLTCAHDHRIDLRISERLIWLRCFTLHSYARENAVQGRNKRREMNFARQTRIENVVLILRGLRCRIGCASFPSRHTTGDVSRLSGFRQVGAAFTVTVCRPFAHRRIRLALSIRDHVVFASSQKQFRSDSQHLANEVSAQAILPCGRMVALDISFGYNLISKPREKLTNYPGRVRCDVGGYIHIELVARQRFGIRSLQNQATAHGQRADQLHVEIERHMLHHIQVDIRSAPRLRLLKIFQKVHACDGSSKGLRQLAKFRIGFDAEDFPPAQFLQCEQQAAFSAAQIHNRPGTKKLAKLLKGEAAFLESRVAIRGIPAVKLRPRAAGSGLNLQRPCIHRL